MLSLIMKTNQDKQQKENKDRNAPSPFGASVVKYNADEVQCQVHSLEFSDLIESETRTEREKQ